MRVVVTGASGRLGRAVVAEADAAGHAVVAVDRAPSDRLPERVEFTSLDLADYDGFRSVLEGAEALVHLGAIPSPGRHPAHVVHDNNVLGSYHALLAAAESGITRICQASSVNAIGGAYSRAPRYDYFPVDEEHPTYNEDPYSLSKWICEQQADSLVRLHPELSISSLRFHGITDRVPERAPVSADRLSGAAKHLWGYTSLAASVRACLAALDVTFTGHEVFYIVAPTTTTSTRSAELAAECYPEVPVRGELAGNAGFFDCGKAARLLGWVHDD